MQQSTPRPLVLRAARPVWVPPWIAIALGEVGVLEDTRPGKSNPAVEDFHAASYAGRASDDVSWCSSFANYCIESAGYVSTRSKTAASYATYGIQLKRRMVFGCITLMEKSDPDAAGSGHVGFALGAVGADSFLLLGGNQNNRVSVDYRKIANIAATCWVPNVPLPPGFVL